MSTSIRRVTAAATFGTTLEWYDFFLYGTAAALVFPQLFFPSSNPLSGTLLSFAVYATGFAARPLGGILFGHLGDRLGRRNILVATLLVMGLATMLVGLLPSYGAIGIAAPILLVVLRVLQGIGTGGEWGGAALLTREHARGREGFWGSFLSSGVYIGLILASTAFTVLTKVLSNDALISWGWRLPFLASALLVVVGILLRLHIEETPDFVEIRAAGERARRPLVEALRSPRNIIAIFFMRIGQNTSFYIVSVFSLVYMTGTLGLPKSVILTATLVGSAVAAVMCPVWGLVGDRFGFRRVMAISLLVQVAFAFPFFWLLGTKSTAVVIVAITLGVATAAAASDAIQPAYFTKMFGARVRYSGVSIGREGGTVVGGGLAPIIATALLAWVGNPWLVAAWMALTSAVGFAAVFLARATTETNRPVVVREKWEAVADPSAVPAS